MYLTGERFDWWTEQNSARKLWKARWLWWWWWIWMSPPLRPLPPSRPVGNGVSKMSSQILIILLKIAHGCVSVRCTVLMQYSIHHISLSYLLGRWEIGSQRYRCLHKYNQWIYRTLFWIVDPIALMSQFLEAGFQVSTLPNTSCWGLVKGLRKCNYLHTCFGLWAGWPIGRLKSRICGLALQRSDVWVGILFSSFACLSLSSQDNGVSISSSFLFRFPFIGSHCRPLVFRECSVTFSEVEA